MAIPWGSLKSAAVFFGPMLLPKALGFYRSLQAESARRDTQQAKGGPSPAARVRPLALRALLWLVLLAVAVVVHLCAAGIVPPALTAALPLPAALQYPENVFVATQSRLQAPTDVVFTRLAGRRPNRTLTAADTALRARIASLDSRLLYLQFGPDVLAQCPFCTGTGVDDKTFSATAYLGYALVDIVAHYLGTLVLVALVTSPLVLLGRKGVASAATRGSEAESSSADRDYDLAARHVAWWRTPASIAVLVLGALDVYLVAAYDRAANARATRLAELDFFFWTMRTYRHTASALLLAGLGLVLYWSATGLHSSPRLGMLGVLLFGPDPPLSPPERIMAATNGLGRARAMLNASAVVKNTVQRDAELRARAQGYWAREVMFVAEAMEEREVVEGINDALQNRIDMQRIERDAEDYAAHVVPLPATAPETEPEPDAGPQPSIVVTRSIPGEVRQRK